GLKEAAKRDVGTGANQIPDMSSFIGNLATNGYSRLPNGLVFQWGWFGMRATAGAVGTTTITLPIAFPVAFLTLSAMFSTQDPSTRSVGFNTALSGRTAINFTYVSPTDNSIFWFAVGC
ncbi:gp53-like domain-containing protein, partial [Enterobacter asburiae]|uniref:gp53-like domain-containing protein n=2 Tax=Enterobacterales TaxID=91347 RepID=UPI00063CB22D